MIASEIPKFEDPLTIRQHASPEQQYQGEDDRAALEAAISMSLFHDYKLVCAGFHTSQPR